MDVAPESVLSAARRIAEEVLLPAAAEVDAADRIPAGQLELLAEAGLFGVAEWLELADFCRVVETLASGCLATAFVWLQHHGALRAVADSDRAGLRAQWLDRLRSGACRAGVAHGGVLPGPAAVRAERVPGGYLFNGESPWVTGWDMIDVLHTAARDETDTVIWALLDASPSQPGTLTVRSLDLVAVAASRTVRVGFERHFVPAERVTGTMPFAEWGGRDAARLRVNGSLALGVVDRCVRLTGSQSLGEELAQCRAGLDGGTPENMAVLRAGAAALAVRATAALAVFTGGRAVLRGAHPERLAREALFLQVFGSRPAIRAALLAHYIRVPKS